MCNISTALKAMFCSIRIRYKNGRFNIYHWVNVGLIVFSRNVLEFVTRRLIVITATLYPAIYCTVGNSLTSLITSHFVG